MIKIFIRIAILLTLLLKAILEDGFLDRRANNNRYILKASGIGNIRNISDNSSIINSNENLSNLFMIKKSKISDVAKSRKIDLTKVKTLNFAKANFSKEIWLFLKPKKLLLKYYKFFIIIIRKLYLD